MANVRTLIALLGIVLGACAVDNGDGNESPRPLCADYCGPDAPECIDRCGRWFDRVSDSCESQFESLLFCLADDPRRCSDADAEFLACMGE